MLNKIKKAGFTLLPILNSELQVYKNHILLLHYFSCFPKNIGNKGRFLSKFDDANGILFSSIILGNQIS